MSEKCGAFGRFARAGARAAGHPLSFGLAVTVVLLWAIIGPLCGFTDTWQLVINTATTIVTFFMVFLIQNTQNRDSEALHLKLDELIRATKPADNALLNIEELSEVGLDDIKLRFEKLAKKARTAPRAAKATWAAKKPTLKSSPPNGRISDSRPRSNRRDRANALPQQKRVEAHSVDKPKA
jgi:low affinity Fe/Cu permease